MNTTHVLAYLHWSTYQLEYGIRSYAREADWTLSFMRNAQDYPNGSRSVKGVILLASPDITTVRIRELYPSAKVVNISDMDYPGSDHQVGCGHDQIARMAVDYLRSLGFRSFACFLHKYQPPVSYRVDHFRQMLAEEGIPCPLIHTNYWNEQIVHNPEDLKQRIRKIFATVQFPIAVFCADDICAESFIHTCLDLGYRIPEDVAVLGVNNSRDICELCRVPLSSIDINFSRRGYEAARILDRLMSGNPPETNFTTIPPLTIAKRTSTEVLVETDKVVIAIREYIREHFAENISMQTILQDMQLSRSSTFARFINSVGHSISKEITEVRMQHARHLLKHSDYKIDYVARLSGYQNTSSFCRTFRKLYEQTPIEYREGNQRPEMESQIQQQAAERATA